MKTAFTTLIEDIILYNNNRFLILLFLVALIFLWITERDKRIKTVLVYFVTAITEKDICVEKTTEPAQIMYDGLTLVKELTTSYYYIAMQSKESALYQAPQGWFPLPFFLPEADAF